ncbi:transcription termination/antitermination protein NusG [Falsiruegeria litorea]|uniref:transcription termination/antitermination protein NusG n=1 Tax=Falsiruegeria litorea TaxID=1280831 RepID=UPI000A26A20E|nr:transcription termination/antitermination NusG family protein [Falsiruegeria litorea]
MNKTVLQPWYVAQLKPNGLRQAAVHLARQGFRTFAPTYHLSHGAGRKAQQRSLFPGYIFVSFDKEREQWTAINHTRGVNRLLADNPTRPAPLPQTFMESLFERCDESGTLLRPEDLSAGDRARILSGPFASLIGKVTHASDQERVALLVNLLGRTVPLDIPRKLVEKL